jgi:serine/threonine protein kinase
MGKVIMVGDHADMKEVIRPIADCVSPEAVLLLQQIRHPLLPRLLEIRNLAVYGQEAVPCFVFEFMTGTSLDRLSAAQSQTWPLAEKVIYMARVARAVAFLHQQGERCLLHLDIKPANLLLGPNQQPILIDFGSARIYQAPARMRDELESALSTNPACTPDTTGNPAAIACTPAFASPELLAGKPCPGSDIYAMGMTLLALALQYEPGPQTMAILPGLLAELPATLSRIINRCLQSQPDSRFSQADELALALETVYEQLIHGFTLPESTLLTGTSAAAPGSRSASAMAASANAASDNAASAPDVSATTESAQSASAMAREPDAAPAKPLEDPPAKLPDAAPAKLPEDPPARTPEAAPARTSAGIPDIPAEPAPAAGRIICIWDSSDFGCELAAQLSKHHNRLLVVDADLPNPRADLLLGQRSRSRSLLPPSRAASLDQAFADQQRGVLTASRLHDLAQSTMVEQVELLVSGSSLEQYEHISPETLYQVLQLAAMSYDLIILLCNRFVYDAFTCLGLLLADQVIIPIAGNAASFREFNRYIDFLALRRQIDPQRLYFVAFPYDAQSDLSWGTMDELCGGRLVGCVSATPARQRLKGSARPYAAAMNRHNQKEYAALIIRLGRKLDKESNHADYYLARHLRRKVRILSGQSAG